MGPPKKLAANFDVEKLKILIGELSFGRYYSPLR